MVKKELADDHGACTVTEPTFFPLATRDSVTYGNVPASVWFSWIDG